MSSRGSFVFRVIGALLLLVLLVAAAGLAFRAGYIQGAAETARLASLQEDGQAVPPAPFRLGYGYYPGYWGFPHWGFFPFGSIIGLIVFFLFFSLALRLIFRPRWGGPWGHHPHRGRWGYPPGTPPWEQGSPEQQGQPKPGESESR